MFLSRYVSDVYYQMILEEYDDGYLSTLSEEQFRVIYELFREYGFTYLEDIILRYLEVFEMDYALVQEKLEELRSDLGPDFIYIIRNNLSLLDRILEWNSCNH